MDEAGVEPGVLLAGVVGLVVGGVVGFGVVGAGVVLGFGVAGFGVVGLPVVGFIGVVDGFVVGFVGGFVEESVAGVVGVVVGGFVVGLVVGVPLFMVPLFIVPVESRMLLFIVPLESRIPLRIPRRIPLRARIPRRLRIVLSLDIELLMELLMVELLPIELLPPERASDMLGRVSPELKPIFMASTSACVSPVTLYLALHVAIARRVVASMRPVTCFTPQPSSRSCCCRASSSMWPIPALLELLPDMLRCDAPRWDMRPRPMCDESLWDMLLWDESDWLDVPVCAMAGAAQQHRAASAATERNVIATSRGGGSRADVRNPCGIATSGPYL